MLGTQNIKDKTGKNNTKKKEQYEYNIILIVIKKPVEFSESHFVMTANQIDEGKRRSFYPRVVCDEGGEGKMR